MIATNARSGVRGLRTNALRSALTILGMVIGVGAVIAMVGVGAGAEDRVREQGKTLGVNVIQVIPGSLNVGGVRGGAGSSMRLTEDDALAIQRAVPSAQAAAPTRSRTMQVVHANANWATIVAGVTPEWFEVKEWGLVDGRPITADEHRLSAKVIVLGQTVAETLFGDVSPIGLPVRIGRVPFTVVGVLERKGQSASGNDLDDVVAVPLSTAQRTLFGRQAGRTRPIGGIAVKVWDGEDLDEAEA